MERDYEANRQELSRDSHFTLFVAFQYGLLKDREKALHWLNRAFHEPTLDLTYFEGAPELDFLRSDPPEAVPFQITSARGVFAQPVYSVRGGWGGGVLRRLASSKASAGSRPVTALYQLGWCVQAQPSLTVPRVIA